MKNLILLPLVAALFLSSCSSKLGIAKRKYTRGYYVSVTKGPSSDKTNTKKQQNLVAKNTKTRETTEIRNEVYVPSTMVSDYKSTSKFITAPILAKITPSTKQQHNGKPSLNASVANHIAGEKMLFKPLLNGKNINAKAGKSGGSVDTNTILLVILCLFWWLNLIAVYLHQGKKITTDFWITLILDLTIILGVIYSILVVLDVLSFA